MQRRHILPVLAGFAAALAVAGLTWAAAAHFEVRIKILTRDPYRAAEVPWYYAYASLAGSALWLASGASTLATALVLRALAGARATADAAWPLLLYGGLLGTVMALDDLLLLHDAHARRLGIPEPLFHAVYGAGLLLMLARGRRALRDTPWPLLLGAAAGFAASSLLDLLPIRVPALRDAEDLFKLAGVTLWAAYFLVVARDLVRALRAGPGDAA